VLYFFLYPLSADVSVFNVFRYITFRSVWALLTALVIAILVGPWFIRLLKRIKFGQYVREDVKAHLIFSFEKTFLLFVQQIKCRIKHFLIFFRFAAVFHIG
jgi:hypothetical protein